MKNRFLIIIFSCFMLLAIIFLVVFLTNKKPSSSTEASPSAIVKIKFPTTKIPYPDNWPEDLRYPEDLKLVETGSGTAAVGERQGWLGKFRCQCTPNEAQKTIIDDLNGKNWSQNEIMRLEAGGLVLTVEKDQGEGIIIIDYDPDNGKQSIILATFFP